MEEKILSLEGLVYEQTLADFPKEKVITVLGRFPAISPDEPCIVKVAKLPLTDAQWPNMSKPTGLSLSLAMSNNEYYQFNGTLGSDFNAVKVDITCPATQRHIDKETASAGRLVVRETPALYDSVTKPLIEARPEVGAVGARLGWE